MATPQADGLAGPRSPSFRRPLPLRWHLVLLILGVLLPVVAFSALIARQLSEAERSESERRLVQSARELAGLVDREMSGTIRVLTGLAESERLERGDLAAFHAEARRVIPTQPSWLAIRIFDGKGTEILDTARAWGQPLVGVVDTVSLRQILRSRRPTVGNLARGPGGVLAFPVRVPVFHEGSVRYVLTAVIAPQALLGLVAPQTTSPEEWTRVVLDARAIAVARTRNPERFVGRHASVGFSRRIRARIQGISQETTLDGTPVYTAFSRAPLSDWTAAIAVPRGVLESPVRHSMLAVAGAGLAVLAFSGLGAYLFARRLSRSIEAAALAAGALARGERPVIPPSAVAEVADLGVALERSADLLRERGRALQEHLARAEAARAEAETASRAKDEFLAMLGHELRNPLGPIRNGVYLLRELLPADPKVERVRAMIERQVVHINRMVDDLLETSRITRGKVVLEKRLLDLRTVAREVCEDFRGPFEQARIRLILESPKAPAWVDGDATRLAQCLGNLLHNALKFTPPGGNVAVSLAAEGQTARLVVQDDGTGIDPDLLPSLFQPFAQGPQALDRSQGGLGLGLALVRGLVELHGGAVEAYSAGAGQGTRFTILLPLAAPRQEPARPATEAGQASRHHILVVEDLQDAAESLAMLLTLIGHEVRVATSARQALEIAREHETDVVICDIGLPDMDGYTLCKELRKLPGLRGACFIALTGYGQSEDVRRAHEAGFAVHLTKPVEPARLREVLDGIRWAAGARR